MECMGFDWKGYALGELSAAETADYDRHARACEHCQAELARYRATVSGLRSLPLVELPRRIVFTSEPAGGAASWWRRMWQSSPQLGFASATVLALAIVAHGLLARVPAPAPVPAAQVAQVAQIDTRIHEEARKEVSRLLPQAVDAALKTSLDQKFQAELPSAFAGLQRQLSQQEQLNSAGLEQRRDADQKAVRYAFEKLERRVNYAMLSASGPKGGE